MSKIESFVITLSRQLGSGGAYLGQQLSKRLGILCADREILSKAAQQFELLGEDFEDCDEKITSFWQSLLRICAYNVQEVYVPQVLNLPSDREFYQAESDIIKRIANESAAVIVGRGGYHVLREHPRHVSVFLHADTAFRQQRIQEVYNLSAKEAKKLIDKSDLERARYLNVLTGGEWTDLRNYDLSINTGKIGFDKAGDIIIAYLEKRFGDIVLFKEVDS